MSEFTYGCSPGLSEPARAYYPITTLPPKILRPLYGPVPSLIDYIFKVSNFKLGKVSSSTWECQN